MSKRIISLYDRVLQLVKIDSSLRMITDTFTVSDIRNIIAETPLTKENRLIATKRYCDKETVEEIADELGYDKRTIEVREKIILCDLVKVAMKIYAIKNNIEI